MWLINSRGILLMEKVASTRIILPTMQKTQHRLEKKQRHDDKENGFAGERCVKTVSFANCSIYQDISCAIKRRNVGWHGKQLHLSNVRSESHRNGMVRLPAPNMRSICARHAPSIHPIYALAFFTAINNSEWRRDETRRNASGKKSKSKEEAKKFTDIDYMLNWNIKL